MHQDSLVNRSLVKAWCIWAFVWFALFPLVGVTVAIKFHNPEFLSNISWLSFGRVRPVHVNGVIFGAFSTTFLGLIYYFVPRLCGIRMYKESWGWLVLGLWNAFLIAGSVSLLMGYNLGLEVAEYEWPLNILRFTALFLISIQVFGTIYRRTEPRFYVALWYTIAALTWTLFNLVLGNAFLPYGQITGVNSAAMHGLYIHYVVGLWMTPAGLAMIYYFLPLSANSPLFSHKLSLLGFWALALVYPFVGTHHYIYSPIPHWTQTIAIATGMLLIIPVLSVTVNFWGTMKGRWKEVLGRGGGGNYAAKFLMLGAFYYLLGTTQGSVEGLRRVQAVTHFNDFVIAHSHLTAFGAMALWGIGSLYYIWPHLVGRKLWSDKLGSWHLWLGIVGFVVMAFGLTAQGLIQGFMLANGTNFVDAMNQMKPWWISRTVGGITMSFPTFFMIWNFYKTAKEGVPIEQGESEAKPTDAIPIRPLHKPNWLETPSTVFVTAGIGFFSFAVIIQGILPMRMSETRETSVTDEVTEQRIQVSDYTPLELQGRQVYTQEGCWYCHSQYIRPVSGESERWGPVAQAGEYAYDRPHLFSTRRIGPDLSRVGRKYGDDWHVAHLWDPRIVVADSIMPAYTWLFEPPENGMPKINEKGQALVAYLQRLGTSIGDWREGFSSTQAGGSYPAKVTPQARRDLLELGAYVYERRCTGCHGIKGDGNGPAAEFLNPKPRNFIAGVFKFKSTPGVEALPTDADLFATLTHGLWGTSMPAWYMISERERLAVIQYIKTFSDRWEKNEIRQPVSVPAEPVVTALSLGQGKSLFLQNCMICHGNDGKGNGPLSGLLNNFWEQPIRPANLTLPAGASGGVKMGHGSQHIFKTLMVGIGGGPMPAYQDQLTSAEIWDIVHYVQSLRVEAHEIELAAAGVNIENMEEARRKMWATLLTSGNLNAVDSEVVRTKPHIFESNQNP
ncbi:MAG TPA: cbb3-type cytochrome c oxidase subunit I [Nitrospirales bacterium]|nr:cbb3-type cytochrome c oxidase subunit I [Nitrospirales bacterium]